MEMAVLSGEFVKGVQRDVGNEGRVRGGHEEFV